MKYKILASLMTYMELEREIVLKAKKPKIAPKFAKSASLGFHQALHCKQMLLSFHNFSFQLFFLLKFRWGSIYFSDAFVNNSTFISTEVVQIHNILKLEKFCFKLFGF